MHLSYLTPSDGSDLPIASAKAKTLKLTRFFI